MGLMTDGQRQIEFSQMNGTIKMTAKHDTIEIKMLYETLEFTRFL